MDIGIPKEVKVHEYRVGATPNMVRVLIKKGHQVFVQKEAGKNIGFFDEDYQLAGAKIQETPQEIYQHEFIVKVKEPQENEFPLLKAGQILFCYLHLAPDPHQTQHLLNKKVIGIAYETVMDSDKRLPLLIPMSEIAGRISIQAGATALQMNHGGKGVLLGGVPGVYSSKVVIVGGGVAGTEAARVAMGMGASVVVIDKNVNRLRELDALFGPRLQTLYSTPFDLEANVKEADLVIGAVLIPGKRAPKIISKEIVRKMSPGSVIVDLAIDQGGCVETSRPTTLANPTYIIDGVVHYCVTNMPGACARTATLSLTQATMSYVSKIANDGVIKALRDDPGLKNGLNVYLGKITNEAVAIDLGLDYTSPDTILKD